jgi:hypothetical protein
VESKRALLAGFECAVDLTVEKNLHVRRVGAASVAGALCGGVRRHRCGHWNGSCAEVCNDGSGH